MKKKLLLVYIGNEQGAWGNIAFPKPSHYYVMPGILYCAAVLKKDNRINEMFEIECLYLNATVQTPEEMAKLVEAANPAVAGFSTFCWNKEFVLYCCQHLKATIPEVRIMLGGPDVSMETIQESKIFFSANNCIDMVAFGEAENKIVPLVKSLVDQKQNELSGITGFACSDGCLEGYSDFTLMQSIDFEKIPSPFPTSDVTVKRSAQCGLAMVYETTRGCPYRCIYCRFGHRSEKIRYKSLDSVEKELEWLIEREFDCIHFADPVFDLEPKRAAHILTFLRDHNKRSSLFFYCSFFHLNEELARLFEQTQCQIGVGVQSTNRTVLSTIRRALAPDLFEDKRVLLDTYKINFYTDLIFGLPNDSFESFCRSLNETINLKPSFMMLFPLTLIKGTPLEQDALQFGMKLIRDDDLKSRNLMCDIEYRNISLFKDFSIEDLESFDEIALTCFYFYNRFRYCMRHLEKRANDCSAVYRRIGFLTKVYLTSIGRKPTNTEDLDGFQDEILRIFHLVLDELQAGSIEKEAFKELFKLDIYRIILLNAAQRQKIFTTGNSLCSSQNTNVSAAGIVGEKKVVLAAYGKIISLAYDFGSLQQLYKTQEEIPVVQSRVYLFSAFEKWDTGIMPMDPLLNALVGSISIDRPVRFSRLISTIRQQMKNTMEEAEIILEIDRYQELGVIKFV